MNLVPNWRDVISHAWSMRLMFVAAVLSGFEAALPFFTDFIPQGLFGALAGLVSAAALVARLIAQPMTLPPPEKTEEPEYEL